MFRGNATASVVTRYLVPGSGTFRRDRLRKRNMSRRKVPLPVRSDTFLASFSKGSRISRPPLFAVANALAVPGTRVPFSSIGHQPSAIGHRPYLVPGTGSDMVH